MDVIARGMANAAVRAVSAPLPAIAGETGVVNPRYPIGDVRRYGIFPDGVDLAGLGFTAGSAAVTAPAGTFSAAMLGMRLCSPHASGSLATTAPKIMAVTGDGTGCTLSANAVASAAGVAARVGTFWELDYPSRMAAVLANATHPQITVVWPRGKYVTSLNTGSQHSGMTMHFDRAEFSGLIHLIASAGFPASAGPLADVVLTGRLTTYDRFGAVGLLNGDLSGLNVTCKSDPTRHLNGVVGRGVHMFVRIIGCRFGDFLIEDCGIGAASNTDAAFALDSSDCRDCSFGTIRVKDSAGHGIYLIGSNHTVRELRVDGWGYGAHDRALQEGGALAQSLELCAVWLRRCPGLRIGTVRTDQPQAGRANALYDLRVDDTANSAAPPAFYAMPRINSLIAANIRRRGISLGDRNAPGNAAHLEIGSVQVQPVSGAVLDPGYAMVHLNANSAAANGRTKLIIGRLTVRNVSGSNNDLLQVPANTEVDVAAIDTAFRTDMGHSGRVFTLNGRGRIGQVSHLQFGGSGSPPPFTVANDGPVAVGQIMATAPGSPYITALDLTGAKEFAIGPVALTGFRGNPAIKLIDAANGVLKLGTVSESTAAGWGIRWQTCTNVRVQGGKITGFAKGATGSAGGNVRCAAVNLEISGNTTQTDIATGQVLTDASCVGVTV